MKFLSVIFALLLVLPVSYACVENGIEISNLNIPLNALYQSLIVNARYNYINDSAIYYFSLNSTDAGVKATNTSLSFLIFNNKSGINYSNLLSNEIDWLVNNSVINYSSSIISQIVNVTCCGHYDLIFDVVLKEKNYVCDETFSITLVDSSMVWLSSLLCILPVILAAVYFGRFKKEKWKSFLLGGAGWFIALFLREQILYFVYLIPSELVVILIASLLAGLFEEGGRFLLFKNTVSAKQHPLLFGLGWGFLEAFVIALNLNLLVSLNQPVGLFESMMAALERNSAIILHVALSLLVVKSLSDRKFLYIAIVIHALFDLLAVSLFSLLGVLALELVILAFSLFVMAYSLKTSRKIIKDELSESKKK